MNVIELFAGCGGLALGLEQSGFHPVLLNEINKDACMTLKSNRKDWNVINSDIREMSFNNFFGKVDLLTGGFPCQSFSHAGKRLGLADTRGTLFYEFARALNEIKPKAFWVENVKGLTTHDEGNTLSTIINVFNEVGYNIVFNRIINSFNYSVPQKRERIFIIGLRNDFDVNNFVEPTFSNELLLRDVLKNIKTHHGHKYSLDKQKLFAQIPSGGNWKNLDIQTQKDYLKTMFNSGGGKTGILKRLSWDSPSLTLLCSPSQKQTERCHPDEIRPLSIEEYARIQTFPDDWIFAGSISSIYRQIGNAVPVRLAKVFGDSIKDMLFGLQKIS